MMLQLEVEAAEGVAAAKVLGAVVECSESEEKEAEVVRPLRRPRAADMDPV